MKLRLYAVAATLAGIAVLSLSACTTSTATDWVAGRSLLARVKEVRSVEEVRYTDQGKHYMIRPSQEDRQLAAAHLEIRNSEATVVYLSVDKDSVRLRDDTFIDYTAINPIQDYLTLGEVDALVAGGVFASRAAFFANRDDPDGETDQEKLDNLNDSLGIVRQEVAETGPDEDDVVPFIWGSVELPPKCGEPVMDCQLVGWMIFEVPLNTEYYQLIWEAADIIYLEF